MSPKPFFEPGATPPEFQFLLACARTRTGDRQIERIRELLRGRELDWQVVISLAVRHRVEALLSLYLDRDPEARVPEDVRAACKNVARERGRWNLRLAARMIEVTDLLEHNGLRAIPYKGPTLASLAYGNLGLRSSEDLDFVLPQHCIPHAFRLLVDAGLRTEFDPSVARHARFVKHGDLGQYLFFMGPDSTMVEFHTERTLRYFPSPLVWGSLNSRLRTVVVAGRSLQTFSVEDLLILLSVHGAKHFWNRLSWICDIAELAQIEGGVDWGLSESLAREMGCRRMWLLGLSLAQQLMDAPLPDSVKRWIALEQSLGPLQKQALAAILQADGEVIRLAERLSFRFASHERVTDSLRQCVRVALRPTEDDWSGMVLPQWAEPLYAVLRPWRLAYKYGFRRRKHRAKMADHGTEPASPAGAILAGAGTGSKNSDSD